MNDSASYHWVRYACIRIEQAQQHERKEERKKELTLTKS
jgi:hypothetical protein